MKPQDRIQWHPAFRQAIRAELFEYTDCLDFDEEFQLTTGPLRLDLIVIKRFGNVEIKKNIGKNFLQYNLIEYKSPEDQITVSGYKKFMACAHLYSDDKDIEFSDMTLSIVVPQHPKKLMAYLMQKKKLEVVEQSAGIYLVIGHDPFLQIIVSRELPEDVNIFLQSLRKNVDVETTKRVLETAKKAKRELDAYLCAL